MTPLCRYQVGLLVLICWLTGCQHEAPPTPPTVADHYRSAKAAMLLEKYQEAILHADRALELDPKRNDVILVAAEACTKLPDFERAIGYYQRLTSDGSDSYMRGQLAQGDLLRYVGRLGEAEQCFLRVLRLQPGEVLARQRLIFILNISGRRWEAVPWMLQEVQSGQFGVDTLLQLGNVERLAHEPEYINKAIQEHPEEGLAWLGKGRVELEERQYEVARECFVQALKFTPPDVVEAQIQFAWLEWMTGAHAELVARLQREDLVLTTHPDYWVLLGLVSREYALNDAAIRCFGETVLRDPDHRLAMYHLGQLLQGTDQRDAAAAVSARAEKLQALGELLEDLHSAPTDQVRLQELVDVLLELNRNWEAAAWTQLAMTQGPAVPWSARVLAKVRERLSAVPGELDQRTLGVDPVIAGVDWTKFALPDFSTVELRSGVTSADSVELAESGWQDQSKDARLNFQFYNDADGSTEGMRMIETMGGGVGVIDYDVDGWPDVYFPQGCKFPSKPGDSQHLDQLYRNLGGEQFQAVTESSNIREPLFSQGVGVGDFDGDGFPDVHVANIGPNQLWLNNGDGTFSNATVEAGLHDESWTSSTAFADLSGDGFPEIIDVNYLNGEGIFTLICQSDGHPRACKPTVFEGEPDRLWLNAGDGRVADVSQSSGMRLAHGNGLGLLIADFVSRHQLDVLVANDAVPNFFLERESAVNLRFRNIATISGTAFDGDGRAQACMGVASADVDGNGLLDMFITNYYKESNTLYLQEDPLIFHDQTAAFGLREPSFSLLGFGTQFVDADLDGWPDLLLVNGHVDDFSYLGTPYQMRPQFFKNSQGKRFVEVIPGGEGDWLSKPQVGRGMARLDWNRDGRDDVVVSYLDRHSALITNVAQSKNHSISLRFVGRTCERSPVGTTVNFVLNGRKVVHQLCGGDGFQASNERVLTIGVGDVHKITNVVVSWPNGLKQNVAELTSDNSYVVVEGQDCFRIPTPRPE
ncbi:MAG: FG-GAP-like repeat-containing protein [Planctomycetaceae bacterium]